MAGMRIGIVIPAFNVAPYIGQALRSVQAQTWRDWTMTVVDDGSLDGTAAIARGMLGPESRLIRQSNMGVSAARNRGVADTAADAILFLDGDDWLAPAALATLAATLRANPAAVAAVGAHTRVPGHRRARRAAGGDVLNRLLVRNLFANGGHLLIRRQALAVAGAFDTSLRFGEDWEYWIRLACLGPFAATGRREPLLFVRERHDSAYLSMAARRESFTPCLDAIFARPELMARLGPAALVKARQRAEAECDWIAGRELVRHGLPAAGWPMLLRSVRAAPGFRRLGLLAAAAMPAARLGPFRRYPAPVRG